MTNGDDDIIYEQMAAKKRELIGLSDAELLKQAEEQCKRLQVFEVKAVEDLLTFKVKQVYDKRHASPFVEEEVEGAPGEVMLVTRVFACFAKGFYFDADPGEGEGAVDAIPRHYLGRVAYAVSKLVHEGVVIGTFLPVSLIRMAHGKVPYGVGVTKEGEFVTTYLDCGDRPRGALCWYPIVKVPPNKSLKDAMNEVLGCGPCFVNPGEVPSFDWQELPSQVKT